jgi:excisionase family DNA binding protein
MEESGNGGRISLSEKLLVSEDEAAQLLGVSKPTFRGMVANGHVHRVALPCGIGRNLYRRSDLGAFVESLGTMPPD